MHINSLSSFQQQCLAGNTKKVSQVDDKKLAEKEICSEIRLIAVSLGTQGKGGGGTHISPIV